MSIKRVRYTAQNGFIANPHKGTCTFQRFNGDPLYEGLEWSEEGPITFPLPAQLPSGTGGSAIPSRTVKGYLPSTVSYCRWFWEIFQKDENTIDFNIIDQALESAKLHKQTLAVRLMSYGSKGQPQVPTWYSNNYAMTEFNGNPQPDHDSEDYFTHWGNFISEFAKRYDNHPQLESVDIAYIGPWGEGAGESSRDTNDKFAELYADAFQETPLIALIEGYQFEAGIKQGSGWRCDCYGDLANPGSEDIPKHASWNHMYDAYPHAIATSEETQTAWQFGPVHLETCWVPQAWYLNGSDIDFILEQGLSYHSTYFMPKSCALPEPWMDKLEAFVDKLGYKFILRQAMYDDEMKIGQSQPLQFWIDNSGIAPIYHSYDLMLRLRQGAQSHFIKVDHVNIREWLPGPQWIHTSLEIPSSFKTGKADLSIALTDSENNPKVRFAVKERYKDNWNPIGNIFIY